MQNKFRFNDGCGRHFEMIASDVFDFGVTHVTPQSWLDQVKISVYTPVKNTAGVRTWQDKLQHPSDGRHWADNFALDSHSPLGGGDDFKDFLEEDLEGDLYDALVDALCESTNQEIRNILDAADKSISSAEFSPVLDDREMPVYLEILYELDNSGDRNISGSVLNQLMVAY